MGFYEAFEERATEYGQEKVAIMLRPGAFKKGPGEWLRRKLNPTRFESLVDKAKGKMENVLPSRTTQLKRKLKSGVVEGAKAVGKGGKAVAKGVAEGGRAAGRAAENLAGAAKRDLQQGYVARALGLGPKKPTMMSRFGGALGAAGATAKSVPAKVRKNWDKLSPTQKALAIGSGAALAGAGAMKAMKD